MRAKVVFSPSNLAKDACRDIIKQLDELDFSPNFLLLFFTEGTMKNRESIMSIFKERFPDVKMLGCVVEAFVVEDRIWTRGVAALLAKFDGKVEVFWSKEKGATSTIEKLGEKIGKGWDAILLMFPALYFPNKMGLLKSFINDRKYYSRFVKETNHEEKIRILRDYSDYLERSSLQFPVNKVLKIMAKKTGGNTPIVGMNLMPLHAMSNTPLILADYREIQPGAAAICFKGKVNAIFHDVFPERGNSYEETFEIIGSMYASIERVEVIKGGAVIGGVDGLSPAKFIKEKIKGFSELSQETFLKKVEDGRLQTASPYGLAFISKDTSGMSGVGLFPYPINLYPSLFDLDNFHSEAIFYGEFFKGGVKRFGDMFNYKKFQESFDFFIVDHNSIMSYGGDIHILVDILNNKCKQWFGVFSSNPSAYLPSPHRKHLTEVSDGVCFNCVGTSTMIEFM